MPKGSIAYPEEIASMVAAICSKDGSYANGEAFILTGGYPYL
jgi:hypothetical protein